MIDDMNEKQLHNHFMLLAYKQAERAAELGEVPVGAIIVKDNSVIGRGYNLRELRQDSTLHAEIMAIRQACRKLRSWRLEGCSLYVTLEPCLMCAGAIIQSRIDKVFFGAYDPKAGACVSVTEAFRLPLHHKVCYQGGLLEAECSAQLKSFFRQRRKLDKEQGSRSKRRQMAAQQQQLRISRSNPEEDGAPVNQSIKGHQADS